MDLTSFGEPLKVRPESNVRRAFNHGRSRVAAPARRFSLRMILSDLPSPAEAGFAKAGNQFPLFGIMR
jgi:hypothetical protein